MQKWLKFIKIVYFTSVFVNCAVILRSCCCKHWKWNSAHWGLVSDSDSFRQCVAPRITTRVANFQKMKFGTNGQRRRDRDAYGVEWGWKWGGVYPAPPQGYPPPQPTRRSGGALWAPSAGPGADPRRKRIWGILSVAERLWLKENQVFCETFITAYTSARTVTGHQLAKIAPVHC